jgi:hypothetical protein
MSIYFGKWREAPGMLLAPLGAKGSVYIGNGIGFFENAGQNPEDIYLGSDIADKVADKEAISQFLKVPVSSEWKDVKSLLWDVMTQGVICRPLMPSRKKLELHLGDVSITKPFGIGAKEWNVVNRELRRQYRVHQKKYHKSKQHLRVLDYWCKQYGTKDWRQFVPEDLPQEEPLPHATTFTDNFDRANGELGANWSVATGGPTIVSNQAAGTVNSLAAAAHVSALSSADHYAQAKITKSATGTARVCTRVSNVGATITELYLALVRPGTPDQLEMWVCNGGTLQQIGTDVGTATWVTGDVLRLESEGSTHRVFRNGSQVGTDRTSALADTALVGGISSSATDVRWDDFQSSDDFNTGLGTGEEALTGSASTGAQGSYTLGTAVPL